MKKILSLVLAAMMIFSVLPAAFAAETAVAAEVSDAQAEAVALLNELGIYVGYENGDMGVDDYVKRYQMSIFATRFKSGRVDDKVWATTENDSGFTDVVDFNGAADYVLGMISYAAQAGIVNGTGDNKFEPELYVKYKEAITMVVRALGQVYSAASYPWAYIQFANDNGLLAGIDTDIAPDDYVSRGVIAQLLYNALFVELVDEDGKDIPTVAEKNFGIGYTTVMLTASNNVVYEAGASTVLSNGKIRFAEIDAQGEPTGADYHADMALFGIADAKAADKAVGTLYNIYYKGNFTGILSAESLAVVYENRGWDNMPVKASDEKNYLGYMATDAYVTIDGTKYQVVKNYTSLKNNQGPKSDAAGTAEMKVFLETGAIYADADLRPGYVLSSDGKYIYKLGEATNSFFTPYAYYSEFIGQWYTQVEGQWQIVPATTFFYAFGASVKGFGIQDDASAASAYANITVSANERMTVREYRLGKITYDAHTRVDMYGNQKTGVVTFKVTYNASEFTTGSMGTTDIPATYYLYGDASHTSDYIPSGYAIGQRPVESSWLFVDEYNWTGLQKSAIAKNSYIIYYMNHDTREIEVIDVIDAANDGDDSYTVAGYIRGFDIANNTLTFGDNYDTYYFDYDSLNGATIYSKAKNTANGKDATAVNFNVLQGKYNMPVTLVIVDGKVVHIDSRSGSDFVIIDNFVSFEEDGIIANAWSTVAKGYTQIKIGSFNGWTVGGIDYWYYFMSQYVGTASVYNLPFETYEVYGVVAVTNGLYDLTDATSSKANYNLIVNEYGYIENVNSSGKWGSDKYTQAKDSDYWMILDTSGTKPVVHSLTGKLNKVTFYNPVEYYKVKSGHFVIVVDSKSDMDAMDFLSGDIAFYKYNSAVNQYDNQNYYLSDGFNSYNYTLLMTNVLTGVVEPVKLGNDSLLGQNYEAYAIYKDIKEQGEGKIYKAENGVITNVTQPVELSDVVSHFGTKVPEYAKAGPYNKTLNKGTTAAGILSDVTASMVNHFMKNGTASNLQSMYNSKVTFLYEYGTNKAFRTFKGDQVDKIDANWDNLYNYLVKDLNDLIASDNQYKAYWVINENGTATVWVVSTGLSYAASKNVTLNKVYTGVADNGDKTSATELTGKNPTFKATLNEVTGVLTVVVDATAHDYMWSGDSTVVAATLAGSFAGTLTGKTIGTDGYIDTLTLTFNGVTAATAGDLFIQIQRNAADSSMSNIRFEAKLG